MVRVLATSVVDCGFNLLSGQTKCYNIGICCFSAKHTTLKSNKKDWLTGFHDTVSVWSVMSTSGLLFRLVSAEKLRPSVVVYYLVHSLGLLITGPMVLKNLFTNMSAHIYIFLELLQGYNYVFGLVYFNISICFVVLPQVLINVL